MQVHVRDQANSLGRCQAFYAVHPGCLFPFVFLRHLRTARLLRSKDVARSGRQTAMLAELPYTGLRDAILTHPTMAEGLGALFAHVPPPSVP